MNKLRDLLFTLLFMNVIFCTVQADENVLQKDVSLPLVKKVMFDRLDAGRIERKKMHYHHELLRAKKIQRVGYFFGGMATMGLGYYLGNALYQSCLPQENQRVTPLMTGTFAQMNLERTRRELEAWERLNRNNTFWGRVRDQVDQGLSVVLCSFIVGGIVHLVSSMSHTSFDKVKKLFGQDADGLFIVTQAVAMKNMHKMGDALFGFIEDLHLITRDGGKIDEKFEDYFYADLMVGYEAFVRSLEDVIAIILESLEQEIAADQKNFDPKRIQVIEREISKLTLFVDEIGSFLEFVAQESGSYDQKDVWLQSKSYMKKISVTMSRFIASLSMVLYGKEFSG